MEPEVEERPSGGLRTKVVRAEIKEVDTEAKTVTAVVSTETQDRDGDIIRQSGWDLKHFKGHPVLLSSHDYRSLLNQIGEWPSMKVVSKELVGTAKFYVDEGNPEADWAWQLAQKGRLAFSVGFIPDMAKAAKIETEGSYWYNFEFKSQELLEVSAVTVPSNPDGLQRMKGIDGLHQDLADIIDEELRDIEPDQVVAAGMSVDDLVERILSRIKTELPELIAKELVEPVAEEPPEPVADPEVPNEPEPVAAPAEPVTAGIDIAATAKRAAAAYLTQEVPA